MYLKKSTVCLEANIASGLNIGKLSQSAFNSYFGLYNETLSEMNTDPCSNPEYKKIKLGRSHIKVHKTPDEVMYFKFLEIQLKNDQIKLTTKRTSM